ncbi:MAG: TIGR02147 family protein [Fibrobacteres bacterium]|nr:TIGR02147 family protein [Fibrobacterota bacterium]
MIPKRIFEYSDYREFLKDHYEWSKRRRPNFSYRSWSSEAGINAPAFFKYIIEGNRGLTKQSIIKVLKTLNLDKDEALYFEQLVFFCQAETESEKNHFLTAMLSLQKTSDVHKLSPESYEYFSKWYHVVIRELAVMSDFQDDFAALGKLTLPSISAAEAKASIALLIKIGLLQKDDKGRYHQTNTLLSGVDSIKNVALWCFQKEMVSKALEAFDRFPSEERSMSGITISVSENTLSQIHERVRLFRKELLMLADSDKSPTKVMTMAINLFPMSKSVKEREPAC